jgi:hypothetical protein
MNPDNNEQAELLRNLWNQLKDVQSTLRSDIAKVNTDLCARIDGTNDRIDGTNARLDKLGADLGARIDATNERIDGTNDRLDKLGADLGARINETHTRLDDANLELRGLRAATQGGFELMSRANHRGDQEVDELRARLDRIEDHVGLRPP